MPAAMCDTRSFGSNSHRRHERNTTTIMSIRIFAAAFCAQWLVGCVTNPPPLPAGNPADPQVRAPARTPRNVLARDETTLAIEKQLSATQAYAESAEKMEHDMGNMPGMQHGGMQRAQDEGMKMEQPN